MASHAKVAKSKRRKKVSKVLKNRYRKMRAKARKAEREGALSFG